MGRRDVRLCPPYEGRLPERTRYANARTPRAAATMLTSAAQHLFPFAGLQSAILMIQIWASESRVRASWSRLVICRFRGRAANDVVDDGADFVRITVVPERVEQFHFRARVSIEITSASIAPIALMISLTRVAHVGGIWVSSRTPDEQRRKASTASPDSLPLGSAQRQALPQRASSIGSCRRRAFEDRRLVADRERDMPQASLRAISSARTTRSGW